MSADTYTIEVAETLARLTRLITEHRPDPPRDQHPPRQLPQRVLLTVEEAARTLGLGKTKTYELVMSGELESVLIGRLRRVHVDSINSYAARLVSSRPAV